MKNTKTRIIFFTIALTYNLILGFHLRDFLILSPTLQVFYLLSVLPILFLTVKINSKVMKTIVFISLVFIACINFAYAVYCRRVFPFLTIISLGIVLIYFIVFVNNKGKDNLLTKIFVLLVFFVILSLLFSAYIFVYKQDNVSLTNGQATLWDTDTVELADGICAECDTDEEKVNAIYEWIIHNFEYDYECEPFIQYFNVRKTLSTRKGICYDFAHLFAAFCRSQNIPCSVVDGDKRDNFQYHFENGSKEAVINTLSYYQNEDGGFGHAVEADCWNPNSIPLHSNTASDIIREIDFEDASHPVIQGLLKWYGSGEHFNGKTWAITVPSNNDYPHAPWWHTDSVSSCHTDYNGTSQIAGFIVRYAERDSELFNLGIRIVNEAIDALSPEDIMDMHTCTCYIRMKEYIEKAGVTDLVPYNELKAKLKESVNKLIVTDKTKWSAYMCKPSQFFNSRESEYYEDNKDIAEYECNFIVNTQLSDGSWDIPWRWNNFADEWAISKNWWKGCNIVLNLLYLKGFGKI